MEISTAALRDESLVPEVVRDVDRVLIGALARLLAARGRDELHRQIVEALPALVGCDQVVLYRRGRGRALRAVAGVGCAGGARDPVAGGRAGAVAAAQALVQQRGPLLAPSSDADTRSGAAGGSLLALPLRAEGSQLGALELCRHEPGAQFTAAERERASAFASLAALALLRAGREAALAEQARRDSLTGLYNHRHSQRILSQLLRGRQPSFALVMLDLDDLKLVNDRDGHPRGDELLRALARMLRRAIRRGDLAFRVGGDEFLLLLPGAGEAEALRVLDRIEHELSHLPMLAGLGLSHGIGVAPADGRNPQELLGHVDARLYAHKRRRKTSGAQPERAVNPATIDKSHLLQTGTGPATNRPSVAAS